MDSDGKIYNLTREMWTIDAQEYYAGRYFADPEYSKLRQKIREIGHETFEIEGTILAEYFRLYNEAFARYYFAVEIALAVPKFEDNLFLIETDIEPLAEFVKKYETEISNAITVYFDQHGEYSVFRKAAGRFGEIEGAIIVDPVTGEPDPKEYPPGRAVSGVTPRPGEPALQEYKPFLDLVHMFTEAAGKRKALYIGEGPETRKTHYAVPKPGASILTEKNRQLIEKTKKMDQETVIRFPGTDISIRAENPAALTALGVREKRVFYGLANYARTATEFKLRSKGSDDSVKFLQVTADIDSLVRAVFPCKGKGESTIRLYKNDLITAINRIMKTPNFDIEDGRARAFQLMDYFEIESRGRGGSPARLTYSIYHGGNEVHYYFPKQLQRINSDAAYSLGTYLYRGRNMAADKEGYYYPRRVSFTVEELITEGKQNKTAESNPREARKRLKELLVTLKGEGTIISFKPETIPTDPAALIEIAFPNDKNFKTYRKFSEAEKKEKERAGQTGEKPKQTKRKAAGK